MNGIDYFVDTNCFIYFLDEHPLLSPFKDSAWAYSVITKMELLSKKGLTVKQDLIIRKLLDSCFKIDIFDEVTELAVKLRRKYALKLPDAIIAASAQYIQLPILTADKALSKIKEIDCLIIEI